MIHGDIPTRCLLAVLGGARSVRDVQAKVGRVGVSSTYRHLLALRREGLVEWESNRHGTLRATVRPVGGHS